MTTKICTKCNRELPIESFRWKNKAENRRHSQCKECQRAQEKIYYQENIARKESVLNTTNAQRERNINIVNQFKMCGCAKCGEKRLHLLDCHHINPNEKIKDINKMLNSASAKTLELELNKCIVLCSNCHRDFHYQEKNQNITLEEYLGG